MKQEIEERGKWKVAWINSDSPQSAIRAYRHGKASALGVSPDHGCRKGFDIRFLTSEVPDLTGLQLQSPDCYESSIIAGLTRLRLLVVGETKARIDLSSHTKMEDLQLWWKPGYRLPPAQAPMRELAIWKYKPRTADLSELPHYADLEDICLLYGNLARLDGVERFAKLKTAWFSRFRTLVSVGALSHTPVDLLTFEFCKAVEDFRALSRSPQLRVLRILNCGTLPSLKMLVSFPHLEGFRFVGTKVLDGDMRPLLKLKSVGYFWQRGYSHRPEEIKRAIGDTFNCAPAATDR